jgi:hypothetical protein
MLCARALDDASWGDVGEVLTEIRAVRASQYDGAPVLQGAAEGQVDYVEHARAALREQGRVGSDGK